MRDRLLVAGLLAALTAAAVLALASFGGAANDRQAVRYNDPFPKNGPFNVKKSSFALIADVPSGGTSFTFDKGFASVTHPSTGVYCLTASMPAKYNPYLRPALLAIDYGFSGGSSLMAFLDENDNCAVNDYEVRTYNTTGGLSNSVAFVIAVA